MIAHCRLPRWGVPPLLLLLPALGCGGGSGESTPPETEPVEIADENPEETPPAPPETGEGKPVPTPLRSGLELVQLLPAEKGEPDPSLERLEPVSEYEETAVEFYEEFWPGGGIRVQGHRFELPTGEIELHGPEWRWHQNGQIHLRRYYRRGRSNGPFVEWFDTGYRKAIGSFVDDLTDGEWLRWFPTGHLRSVKHWVQGKPHGSEHTLFPSGRVNKEIQWKDGKKHGGEWTWHATGDLGAELFHVEGKKTGVRRDLYPGGQIARRFHF